MIKKISFISLAFLFLYLFSFHLYADTQELIYNKVTATGNSINTLKFKFKQKIMNEGKESIAVGEIFYKESSDFKVIYKKPNYIEYISDGKFLWIIDVSKKQVLKKDIKDNVNFFG